MISSSPNGCRFMSVLPEWTHRYYRSLGGLPKEAQGLLLLYPEFRLYSPAAHRESAEHIPEINAELEITVFKIDE